jgi:hypothetical protein
MQDQEAQSAADSTKCWRWHMFMSPRNTVEKYSEIKNKMIRHKVLLIELTCTRPEQTIKKKKDYQSQSAQKSNALARDVT